MAIHVKETGKVVRCPRQLTTKTGNDYWELIVNFGDKKRDDWYVRVWKTSYKKLMDCLDINVSIHVEGKITKWQKGEGYGVVIEAEVIELV